MTRSRCASDGGFTLVELTFVLVVVGILAAVAIPVFLSQREKAHDISTVSDVTRLGKEIATFHIDGRGAPTLDFATDPETVFVVDGPRREPVRLSNGTARPSSGSSARLDDPDDWCVSLIDLQGAVKQYRFSAQRGLEPGGC